MSLRHILLGLLEEPHSGYSIKLEFERVFKHFWSAELAQIYPALDRLEQDGLASSKQQVSEKGPARRIYSRNAKGSRELKKWLAEGPTVGKDRIHYLAQVFFLSDLNTQQRLAYFEKLKAHFIEELDELKSIEEHWQLEAPGYPDKLGDEAQCQQFTLRSGLGKIAANIEWCDDCIAVIEAAMQQESLSA